MMIRYAHEPQVQQVGLTRPSPSQRRVVMDTRMGVVERVSVDGAAPAPCGFSPRYQVAVAFSGGYEFTTGKESAEIDATRLLFVRAQQDFRERHLVGGLGHDGLIITFPDEFLVHLNSLKQGPTDRSFARLSAPCSPSMLATAHRIARAEGANLLAAEELLLKFLQGVWDLDGGSGYNSSSLVSRAKELLHSWGSAPASLSDLAEILGVTPTYLTQAFTRSEGIPLYRYQTRLRLAQALQLVPASDDLTGLALDLGFSSHSHFSNVFKAHLGMSPSSYRETIKHAA